MTEAPVGLRERKKRETREALARAGLQLFVERGYDETTLHDIADAAGVSTRTIFAYFASKEDILFSTFQTLRDELARTLDERAPGTDTLTVLRGFCVGAADAKTELDRRLADVIAADATLASHKRARIADLQEVIARGIAQDLGVGDDDLRPRVAAASLTAAFELLERQTHDHDAPVTNDDVAAALDPIMDFVRAGLQALPR